MHPIDSIEQEKILCKPVSPEWRNRLGVILAVFFAICILLYAFSAPGDFPKRESIFTITPGQSLKSVGTELKTRHYIQSRFIFATLVTLYGAEKEVPSGDYFFSKPISVLTLARQIALGHHDLIPIKVTIPEGSTVSEIGAILAQKVPNFDVNSFVQYAKPNEGYLFPETYFIFSKTNAKDIADEMRTMFDTQTNTLFASVKKQTHTKKDIVIMASIIEREARKPVDKELISGILWKRISINMPLQVDAPFAYIGNKSTYELTTKDLKQESEYNTYTHTGLPPGPISNPGIDSILYAIHPKTSNYLYYLSDRLGNVHYAVTYAEHKKNKSLYIR